MTTVPMTRERQADSQWRSTSAAAQEMRDLLSGVPAMRFVRRLMPEIGLEVVLERQAEEQLRLALVRADRTPSVEEMTAAGNAFGVPEGCEWVGAVQQSMGGRSMFVCEVAWRER